ncbi:polyprenyl synthetase family protein [Paenibacillus thalictri]|uniref:Polyprenyl synthetase n=1 Tax=Paenibacillus thalictri TaxID=2527873 RepID=A0A4Q9DY51_9BACL|nr:polyprenyl synthetase family protein [Paenibacillus thalictri]TBL81020.1 hypothetical protein EYB31_02685 [Paenibacillus thalictri]
MIQEIKQMMFRIVDGYIHVEDLNAHLKTFILDKERENTSWSDITVCTHYMLGGRSPHVHQMAAVTELLILALDIMDDWQDEDHDSKSWRQCSQAVALNAILALVMGVVGEWGQLQIKDKLLVEASKIITRSVNGQQKDVTNSALTADDYLLMTQEKSGSLFRFACFMGYSSLDCAAETLEKLHDLTDCIGLVHQIQNDMKDLAHINVKSDLLSKKRTLPILYLLSNEDPAFDQIKDYYAGRIEADFLWQEKEEIAQMIHNSGCLEYARIVQNVCLQKAEEIYGQLDVASPWKERFRQLTYESFLD